MRSHTSCVFPMLRVCPPTTITRHVFASFISALPGCFPLELLNAFRQFRKPGIPNIHLFEFTNLPRGCPPYGLPGTNGLACGNAGLRSSDCAILQGTVLCDAHLSAHDHVVPQDTGAGNTSLRGDHRMRADLYVMSNVDQIIQLHIL